MPDLMLNMQAVRALPLREDTSYRVMQTDDNLYTLSHGLDSLPVEHQPIQHCPGERALTGYRHVLPVCRYNLTRTFS